MTQTDKVDPVLRHEPADDPLGPMAFRNLTDRAWESCGIVLHYQTADTQAEATMGGMSHALQKVLAGFAAAALTRIASDPRLGLTDEQYLYLHECDAELDLSVVEDLTGANGDGTESPAAERTL